MNEMTIFVPAAEVGQNRSGAFVAVVTTREDLAELLAAPNDGLQWIEVRGLLADPEAWARAAQGPSTTAIDVVLDEPARDFASLYQLVDVRAVRDTRVTIHVQRGFLPALRLATALQLPVRLLLGRPDSAALVELREALEIYLHDTIVEAPIEPLHTLLASRLGRSSATLWEILECDPAYYDGGKLPGFPPARRDFVASHVEVLIAQGSECANCPWVGCCAGYFKWPDPAYSCRGIWPLLERLDRAAKEIAEDLQEAARLEEVEPTS